MIWELHILRQLVEFDMTFRESIDHGQVRTLFVVISLSTTTHGLIRQPSLPETKSRIKIIQISIFNYELDFTRLNQPFESKGELSERSSHLNNVSRKNKSQEACPSLLTKTKLSEKWNDFHF